jgi:hypothetical protein
MFSEQVGAAIERILSLGSYGAPLALKSSVDGRPTDIRPSVVRPRPAAQRKPKP